MLKKNNRLMINHQSVIFLILDNRLRSFEQSPQPFIFGRLYLLDDLVRLV